MSELKLSICVCLDDAYWMLSTDCRSLVFKVCNTLSGSITTGRVGTPLYWKYQAMKNLNLLANTIISNFKKIFFKKDFWKFKKNIPETYIQYRWDDKWRWSTKNYDYNLI